MLNAGSEFSSVLCFPNNFYMVCIKSIDHKIMINRWINNSNLLPSSWHLFLEMPFPAESSYVVLDGESIVLDTV